MPAGQGSVISPCCPTIPSVQKQERKCSCGSIACSCTEKKGKTAQRGKNKRQTSVFNAGAAIPCSAGAMGRRAARRSSRQCRLPTPSAPCRHAHAPRIGGMGAAFRFGWSGSRSRRRQAHEQGPAVCKGMRWATLPCPAGKGTFPVCGIDAVCPAGKSASELARLILKPSRRE